MPRPKKIKSPEDFGKEFDKLKKTIPAEKKYSPEVESVGEALEAFYRNPNKETEKELYERSRELGGAIGGGITIFGDRETTEKVCEELKKYDNQMGKEDLSCVPETKFEKATKEAIKEGTALEELQELEKKLRACTDETPRDIRYKIECNRFILVLQYNSIEVRGDVFYPEMLKGIYIDFRKSELATAHKMHEVLKEWREE